MKNIIIGTAGHIDHGKTTLIKALTGRNTDRWEEEQRRGITMIWDLPTLIFQAETGQELLTCRDMRNLLIIWLPELWGWIWCFW